MASSDDGGFGSGMGGGFGTSGYDPHRAWDGPFGTRGVMRDGSRVPREHDDDRPYGGRGYRAYGPTPAEHAMEREHTPNPQGFPPTHLSEWEAQQMEQHGYGRSQYPTSAFENEPRGPHYGKGPKGYKRSDERIHEEVCEAIARHGFIDASDVEVTVEAGVVRLVGTVASKLDKRGLEHLADRVHGVEDVWNELRLRRENAPAVAPSSTRTVSQNDVKQSGPQNGKNAHS